ncbi:MAG TPA: class I SAM-dependent methyltransferase [Vicinamibacterales bacterium]|nr:class I SAM-dependent methyltransferase [Vicinamibacterales bacterium]
MIEGRPSATAELVAVRRAVHQLLDRPLVFEDPLALAIVGREWETRFRAYPFRAGGGTLGTALRAHLVVRSRVAEDELAAAVMRGVRQYVVLGAGLDTFICRNPHRDLRVFEVDFPATQQWKRDRLRDAGLDVPATAVFVACEFTSQSIGAALERAGLDRARPTFFSWLGVTMYLEPATTLRTVRELAPLAVGGGGLVFDYTVHPDTVGLVKRLAFKVLAGRVARAGEPFIGFFDPLELVASVRRAGFTQVDDLSAADLTARFLTHRSDGLRLSGLGHILCASS